MSMKQGSGQSENMAVMTGWKSTTPSFQADDRDDHAVRRSINKGICGLIRFKLIKNKPIESGVFSINRGGDQFGNFLCFKQQDWNFIIIVKLKRSILMVYECILKNMYSVIPGSPIY